MVLGPTGAGKTTLLRALGGLEQPDAGNVTMAGKDVTALDPASREAAFVFQNFSLYPRGSVRKNLEFPLRALGRSVPEDEIQRVVEHTGPTTTLLLDWAGAHVHVLVPRPAGVRPGDRVCPLIDPERAVLFEAAQAPDHHPTKENP